jgi:type I restriction enzyme S subunit
LLPERARCMVVWEERAMSFPRYPKYKASGVEWLGEVPAHWEVTSLKRIVSSVESGTSVNSTDEPAAPGWPGVLKTSCVYSGNFDPHENKSVDPEDVRRVSCPLRSGTLIVSRMNTPDLIGAAGSVADATANIYLPDRLWQVSVSGLDIRFVHFWTLTSAYRAQVEASCTGTSASMKNLSQDQFLAFSLAVPPPFDCERIAEFLASETAKIDALVAEQQRLIELLKEKRQAVISHAVTKGLDPTAKMKPSGIEWLGDVPAHWEVVAVRRLLSRIEQGWSPECDARPAEPGEWGVLKAGCVNRGAFTPTENKVLPSSKQPPPEFEVRPGDLLMSRASGSPELVGSAAIVRSTPERLLLSDKIFRLHSEPGVATAFLAWTFGASLFRHQIERAISGGDGLAINLPQAELLGFVCPRPPLSEQLAIAALLDRETVKIDALVAEAERAITLLQERRTALISAAVTGQIDVTQLATSRA